MIIGKVLAKRAMISPERQALIFNDQVLTFKELNHRANQLAQGLLALGIAHR